MAKEWSPRGPTGIIFKAGDVIVSETGTYPNDALDVFEHSGGVLVASPLGGGSVYRFHPRHLAKYRFRIVAPEEMKLSWYPGEFGMDILPRDYKGWTTGILWNGFATPSFEFEAAKAILDEMIAATKAENLGWIDGYEYDPGQDAFIVRMSNDPEHPDVVRGEWTAIPKKPSGTERTKLYPLGSGYWTWTEKARRRRKSR
jgi:hypothetical protein